MQPSATELEALEQLSVVVPDTLIMEEVSLLGRRKAATVSPNVLAGILGNPAGLRVQKNAIEKAMAYNKDPEKILSKALANVGSLFAEEVDGRVATEIDPRLAHDTGKMVTQARHLIDLYQEMKVPRDKLIIKFPGTWEGIQASKELESEGVATLVFLVFSFIQAVAAAQAGVSVIQPNVGRLHDWYKAHPGIIRDPKGPREDSGYSSLTHPGHALVKRIYNYCKKYHQKTLIMSSGIRTKEDALAIAGCDYIILGPKVLQALNEAPTAMGYNDGYTAQGSDIGLEEALSEDAALVCRQDGPWAPVTEESFKEGMDLAARELLAQTLKGLVRDVERVMPFFEGMAVGTE